MITPPVSIGLVHNGYKRLRQEQTVRGIKMRLLQPGEIMQRVYILLSQLLDYFPELDFQQNQSRINPRLHRGNDPLRAGLKQLTQFILSDRPFRQRSKLRPLVHHRQLQGVLVIVNNRLCPCVQSAITWLVRNLLLIVGLDLGYHGAGFLINLS